MANPLLSEADALQYLSSTDAHKAERAFATLIDTARPYLQHYLLGRCNLSVATEREDIVQEVFIRLWKKRRELHFSEVTAWHTYIRQVALNTFIDHLRANKRLPQTEEYDTWLVPDEERSFVDALLIAAEVGWLRQLADIALLELDSQLSPNEQERRLLAAKLFYIDGEPWEYVRCLLGAPMPTREELDDWLIDPRILRHLAYRTLLRSSDQVTAYLLGLTIPSIHSDEIELGKELDRIAANTASGLCLPEGSTVSQEWSPDAIRVLLWRYRSGLLPENIVSRSDCALDEEELKSLFERANEKLPFYDLMQRFVSLLIQRGDRRAAASLQNSKPNPATLWQRLAFEYRYRDELVLRDIQDRTHPPATVVGGKVTFGMLNMWLSGGRLLHKVAQFAQRHQVMEGEALV